MKILGISGGFRQGYQDVSATLVIDGKVIVAAEEERFNRIKFSPGKLPILAVKSILEFAQLEMKGIDVLAFHGSTWGDDIDEKIREFYIGNFGYCPPIERHHHHDCHAASTYFASGFDESLIITADNSGDGISLQIGIGKKGNFEVIERFSRPNSFGLFYQMITQICGFTKDSDEYKVMGLSSWGDRTKYDFSDVLFFEKGAIHLNQKFIKVPKPGEPSLHKDELAYTSLFEEKIKLKRRTNQLIITEDYKNLAASAQQRLEDVFCEMALFYLNKFKLNKICLAGGVALNCVLNQRLLNLDVVADLFVQPASSDAGISLGAAWLSSMNRGVEPIKTQNTYLGLEYSSKEVENILVNCGVSYTKPENPAKEAALLIAEGKVIGWFQGRSEFGPRALGNRSILASPSIKGMQLFVNQKIKFRESFRPFAPSILEQDMALYFEGKSIISPHMTVTFNATDFAKESISEVVHVDKTSRIQTVNNNDNPLYFELLSELKKITGHGVVMNTSFNLSHEPIVETPRDAIASFFASGLDVLFLGDFKIEKKN